VTNMVTVQIDVPVVFVSAPVFMCGVDVPVDFVCAATVRECCDRVFITNKILNLLTARGGTILGECVEYTVGDASAHFSGRESFTPVIPHLVGTVCVSKVRLRGTRSVGPVNTTGVEFPVHFTRHQLPQPLTSSIRGKELFECVEHPLACCVISCHGISVIGSGVFTHKCDVF